TRPHARTRFAGGVPWPEVAYYSQPLSGNGSDPTMELPSTRGTRHGTSVDRCTRFAASPAHAAGHADAGPWTTYSTGLRSPRPALCRVPRPLARHSDAGGYPPLPVGSARERRGTCVNQQRGLSAAVPVSGDTAAPGPVPCTGDHPLSPQTAGRAQR